MAWSVQAMDLLQERVAAGVSEAAIAVELGLPEPSVVAKRQALGLRYPEKVVKTLLSAGRPIAEATQTVTPILPKAPPRETPRPFVPTWPKPNNTVRKATLASVKGNSHRRPKPTMPAPPAPPSDAPGPIAAGWAAEKAKTVAVKIEEPPKMPRRNTPMSPAARENLAAAMRASHARRKGAKVGASTDPAKTIADALMRAPTSVGDAADIIDPVEYWQRREAEKSARLHATGRDLERLRVELRKVLDENPLFAAWLKLNDIIAALDWQSA